MVDLTEHYRSVARDLGRRLDEQPVKDNADAVEQFERAITEALLQAHHEGGDALALILGGFVKNRRNIYAKDPFDGALSRLISLADTALKARSSHTDPVSTKDTP